MAPVEPPPTSWELPDPRFAPAGQELLAVGADLLPGTMLAAYRRGLFPMDVTLPDETEQIGWWSPDPRGVLLPDRVRVSRSLRRSRRHFTVTFDQSFDEVVTLCADPRREHGWITPEFQTAYRSLFEFGWAHSVEVWQGESSPVLVGGLFGIQVGGLFAAESKFHRATDASKVAVVALAEHLAELPAGELRMVDAQWPTPHLESLGFQAMPRSRYLAALTELALVEPSW